MSACATYDKVVAELIAVADGLPDYPRGSRAAHQVRCVRQVLLSVADYLSESHGSGSYSFVDDVLAVRGSGGVHMIDRTASETVSAPAPVPPPDRAAVVAAKLAKLEGQA